MTRPPSRGDEPHLTNLALPFPPRPVLLLQPHEAPRSFERLVSRLHLEHGVAADDLLGSLKGPSVTLSFPPETRTRAPVELADSPPVWIREPSLRESSVSLAMASMSAWGGGPWLSADFTIDRKRMAALLLVSVLAPGSCLGSPYTTSEGRRNRHAGSTPSV